MNVRQILACGFGITVCGALLWLKHVQSLLATLYDGDNILHLSNVPLSTQVTAVVATTAIFVFCLREKTNRFQRLWPQTLTRCERQR